MTFSNHTGAAGLGRFTPTFSIAVSDIDGDGVDDLFVGHHGFPPALYLNRSSQFVEQADALPPPLRARRDRHGYTFMDFDNDGDKDFVVAGGGADGIGQGVGNEIYKNLLVETGRLAFVDVTQDSDISNPSGRTRHFHPLPNLKGDKVDLYSTGLHKGRPNSKNLFAVNNSTAANIVFKSDNQASLHLALESDGKDLFFDYDRDGLMDFLSVGQGQARLYRNNGGDFTRNQSVLERLRSRLFPSDLEKTWGVISAVSADFNNDGYPDLYLGCGNGQDESDHVVSNSDEIHFSVTRQAADTADGITFRMKPARLKIDFTEHVPSLGRNRTDASDIFIGAERGNPQHRMAQIGRAKATGKPENREVPGTYIWYDPAADVWHVLWKQGEEGAAVSKGIIYSQGIELLSKEGLESTPAPQAQDYILINDKGRGWTRLELPDLKHRDWTNYLTAADFNNDGNVDIVGVRTGANAAAANGQPFLVLNNGDLHFTKTDILDTPEDDIFHADIIVHGFFNDDGLPDLFYTNGYGLLPGHVGPYQLWLNTTDTPNGYLLLELEGTRANRDAIGAQVTLYDMQDRLIGYRELGSDFGRGQNTHKIHFGLGDSIGPFSIRIRWPGSSEWQQTRVERNRLYRIQQN
ncbi:MAG: CRTAC1 family protein [Halioglobus sp.]